MRFSVIGACLLLPCALVAQNRAQLASRIDSALVALQAKGFSGSVRVETDGELLIEKGYGMANRADGVPMTPASIIQIGSCTKDFTVVALLQLQERGLLSVQDTLGKFFRAVPADKSGITLWQLVTHRAGFPIGVGADFEPITRAQLLDRAFQRPLDFVPGSKQSYSNTGYSILAAVIETVSGKSYDEFLQANILNPLQLKNTGYLLPNFAAKTVVHGYRDSQDVGTVISNGHAADGPYWNLRGNGGMLSTLDDMHRFYSALFTTDKLLKPATRNLRFSPDEPVGLAGSDLVSAFLYERLPGRRVEIIIATNSSAARERIVREAIGAVLGFPSPDGGPPVAAGPRPNAKTPAPAVVALLSEYLGYLNKGDSAGLRAFFEKHLVQAAGAPSIEDRVTRQLGMHQNLGVLTVAGFDELDPATVEVSLTSATEGSVKMKVQIDPKVSGRILGFQFMVGG